MSPRLRVVPARLLRRSRRQLGDDVSHNLAIFFKPYPGTRKELDLLTGIAPIFRIDQESGKANLIGTGFWVTDAGHLVTAWHVVQENIDRNGVDCGPIFAIQTFSDRSCVLRNFRKSDKHPEFDLALSETVMAPHLKSGLLRH